MRVQISTCFINSVHAINKESLPLGSLSYFWYYNKISMDKWIRYRNEMLDNFGIQGEPKVGIFWYNRAQNELFGIASTHISKLGPLDNTEATLHRSLWTKEFNRRKKQGRRLFPFIGDYKNKPRGRIFYDKETNIFTICVGKWINEYPEAKELILEEFDLTNQVCHFEIIQHWEIGMGWGD